MIWLKRAAKTAQEDVRESDPVVREMLARIEENGENVARAMTFAFFMLLVVPLIACPAMSPLPEV